MVTLNKWWCAGAVHVAVVTNLVAAFVAGPVSLFAVIAIVVVCFIIVDAYVLTNVSLL